MSQDPKDLVRRYYEQLWNRWEVSLAAELLAPDFRFRGSLGDEVTGIDAFVGYMNKVRAAFPDYHNEIVELVADGDRVAARLEYRGRHEGELFGIQGSGGSVRYAGSAHFRVADGKLAQAWVLGDLNGLLRQLGAGPTAARRRSIPLFIVDAFAERAFAGNPAGVCPLPRWLDDAVLQSIARENGFSETAFFVRQGDVYHLRWFTPTNEMDLCGHATLASAHVLFDEFLEAGTETVKFTSRSGPLEVRRREGRLELDFPARPPEPCAVPEDLVLGLGRRPTELSAARDYLAVFDDEEQVRALRPDFAALCRLDRHAVIVTAPGKDCDFVSRFFAPHSGVPEDPVTGSSHCTLIPYWSKRLGKTRLHARQVSARGGELFCEDRGERVGIAGSAVTYMRGRIEGGVLPR